MTETRIDREQFIAGLNGTVWGVEAITDDLNLFLADNHYLGPLKSAQLAIVGRHQLGAIVACQLWRRPTARNLPNDGTWLELSRWCLTAAAGANAGSRGQAATARWLRRHHPDITTLVSYSDPSQGHTGALYRACNWQWSPAWHRLRPPPTGQGAWTAGQQQHVKDRWIYAVQPDPRRGAVLAVKDAGAIRAWARRATPAEIRLARNSPAPDLAAHAEKLATP